MTKLQYQFPSTLSPFWQGDNFEFNILKRGKSKKNVWGGEGGGGLVKKDFVKWNMVLSAQFHMLVLTYLSNLSINVVLVILKGLQ